ncbi:MAG TPA: hypothetical protein VLC48_05325 [Gemmatimonadota bacterium]|nr:hypothetical protein [Gemmatimonadota bacterium]
MSTPATLHYRFPGAQRIVSARIDAPELIPHVQQFYAAYRCPAPHGDVGQGEAIAVEREGHDYRVAVASGAWEAENVGDAVLFFEYELTDELLHDAGDLVHLHGAAVFRDERCLLLIGPSGAGKSTLALGLSLSGWNVLADDALLIDPRDCGVQPFDRSIRVHEASLRALDIDANYVPGARLCDPYLWLAPIPGSHRATRYPSGLVFLKGGAETKMERLGAAVTLKELLAARLSDQAQRDFDCLARLAAQSPGYRLSFEDFPAALAELRRL